MILVRRLAHGCLLFSMGRGFDPRWGHEETRQSNAGPAPAVPMFSALYRPSRSTSHPDGSAR